MLPLLAPPPPVAKRKTVLPYSLKILKISNKKYVAAAFLNLCLFFLRSSFLGSLLWSPLRRALSISRALEGLTDTYAHWHTHTHAHTLTNTQQQRAPTEKKSAFFVPQQQQQQQSSAAMSRRRFSCRTSLPSSVGCKRNTRERIYENHKKAAAKKPLKISAISLSLSSSG